MKVSKKSVLTRKRLKEVLSYNPLTGIWIRIKSSKSNRQGVEAGYIDKTNGYRRIKIDGILYKSNRLAFLYMEGYFPEYQVDHINRTRHDDKWKNLRHVTPQCNVRNCGLSTNNQSGIKGVYFNKKENKWKTFIYIDSKYKHLGYFKIKDFTEAVLTRLAAEQCLNWAGCDSSSTAYNYAIKHNLIRR